MTVSKNVNYAIVGASGYIAPRHVKAINETNGRVTSIIDINFIEESLKLFPDNVERFFNIQEYLNNTSSICDYLVICSPNFLHEEQISVALDAGLNVICEKPVALNLTGLKRLQDIETISAGCVNTILQLRLHPSIQTLKESVHSSKTNKVQLIYVAKRSKEYFETWKGKKNLSGGMITNVGIHYLDLMTHLFGEVIDLEVETNDFDKSSGKLYLENGSVDWLFSFNPEDVSQYISEDKSAHRSILLNNESIDFSEVPEDLHTTSYKNIIKGNGFSLQDAESSIALIDRITGTN